MIMLEAKATGGSVHPTVQLSAAPPQLLQQLHLRQHQQPAKIPDLTTDVTGDATQPIGAAAGTSAGGFATRHVGDADGTELHLISAGEASDLDE